MLTLMTQTTPAPPPFLSGQFLLSMPGMGDERFSRAVIAMCAHDDESALGIVINHVRGDVDARGLMDQLDIDHSGMDDAPVYAGGPVEPQRGFVLHSTDYEGQGTLNVAGRWALTATLDILRDIGAGNGPAQWLIALGYTGWGEGQLERELTQHGWMSVDGDGGIMWNTHVADRWPRAFESAGIDVSLLSATSGRA
jgi:putative transcriptional regulator|tara:strand:- start:114876 stop:115463 length:588 start_codon:yes stop_codon:yes gene_type:complete